MSKFAQLRKAIDSAVQRLSRKKEYFSQFDSIEDWIVNGDPATVEQEGAYFSRIKNTIISRYKAQDIYLSSAAVDDIIFNCLQVSTPDTLLSNIESLIHKSGITNNSVVIFPMHDFGFQMAGLANLTGRSHIGLRYDNFQVNSQSNSFDRTIKSIKTYLDDIRLPYRTKIDYSLFQHFYLSRSLKWFERNPLIYFHFKFSQQERYDNIAFILEKLSFITNKLYFVYVLRSKHDDTGILFSTTNTNNWETLDINHFLTITRASKRNQVNCIPVHYKYSLLYEDMHMNIDMLAKKKGIHRWEARAIASIDSLYAGYRNFLISQDKRYGMYYRIANSMKFFRRSVKSVRKEDRIININTALETLLLDKMETSKRAKMLDRIWAALKGKINKKTNLKNIESAIEERNDVIHNGLPTTKAVDLNDVYRSYCQLILFLHDNIDSIDATKPEYLSTFYSRF